MRVAIRAVVTRLFVRGHRRLAHRLELGFRFVRVIRGAVGDHLLGDFAVTLEARGLVDRAFVVTQAKPLHRFEDRVDGRLRAALAIGVLDAQDEVATMAPRFEPAVQRGARAADVQVTGGAGGETGADGHGLGTVGKTVILRDHARRRRTAD